MAIATLQSILFKIRKLIGLTSPLQISDTDLKDYINSFYLYDLPAQFRSLKLKDVYTFDTIQGIETYAFDSERYTTVEMPCYCAKREIQLFQDPWSFYGVNYNWQYQTNFAFGDGTTGPYSGLTSATPIIRSSNNDPTNLNYPASRVQNILITANTATSTLNVTDNGNGNLIGDCSAGTIDYQTGQISGLLFTASVPPGNPIQIQYNPVQLSIPLSILFFQNQFTLRPVPDRGYTIELVAYRKPTQALMATPANLGTPELNEWWELVAVGAAKKFFEDSLDFESTAVMDKMLRERYALAETRTYAQLGKQRVSTIFADQLQYNYGSGGLFGSV